MEITVSLLILIIIITFFAFTIKGLLGFGPSLILIPILSFFLNIKDVIIITALADVLSSGIMFLKNRTVIRWKTIAYILCGLFIGTFIGVKILAIANPELLRKVLGLYIVLVVVKRIFFPSDNIPKQLKRFNSLITGIISGFFGGLFNINGPIIVLYLTKVFQHKATIRGMLAGIFFVDAVWRILLMLNERLISGYHLSTFSFVFLPFILLGLKFGTYLHLKLKEGEFKKFIEFLILIFGASLILK